MAFILSSCTDKHADSVIAEAQQLLNTKPDSALVVLDSIRGNKTDWPRSQQMRYELVYAQAQNKAYVNFTTDSIVLSLVDYYERHGNVNEQMMANYMAGCAYRDLEDALSALKYLNRAVDAVDESDEDCDLNTLMRVYSQMARLYQRVAAFENDRKVNSHAERLAWQIGDTLSTLRLRWARACSLFEEKKQLQAIMILDSIDAFIQDNKLQESPILIYPMKTDYYLEIKDIKRADALLREYEHKSGILTESIDAIVYDIAHFHRKGQYYNLVQNPDSAIQMFNKLLYLIGKRPLYASERHGLMEVSYQGLTEAYSLKHQPDSVIKYANLYCQWNDSSTRAKSSEHLLRYQSLYNYTKIQEQALKAEQKASRLRVTMILLVVIGIAIAIIVWSIYQERLNKERQKQIETNKGYQSLLHEIEKSAEELQLVKTDSERFLKEKELEIQSLQTALSMYQGNVQNVEQWNNERTTLQCDLVHHLHSLSAQGKMATQDELDGLVTIAQNVFQKFHQTITDPTKRLSNREIITCILIRFKFIPSEIAVLTNNSYQQITNLKSTINKKLFDKNGAKTLDSNLMSLK
ncbi:MAG: hypothetical protein UH687_07480 [Bacteroidaceae bacterium]|nr:hypothetical protein [Bacteroidaceae bacterium]